MSVLAIIASPWRHACLLVQTYTAFVAEENAVRVMTSALMATLKMKNLLKLEHMLL